MKLKKQYISNENNGKTQWKRKSQKSGIELEINIPLLIVFLLVGKQGRPVGYQVTATNLATGSTFTTTSAGGKWRSIR